MDDIFQFMVMNSWKINMNLPFLFGDRQAVRCQIWVFNFSSQNLYWVGNRALKGGYFFSREEGGGDISESCIFINFKAFNAQLWTSVKHLNLTI